MKMLWKKCNFFKVIYNNFLNLELLFIIKSSKKLLVMFHIVAYQSYVIKNFTEKVKIIAKPLENHSTCQYYSDNFLLNYSSQF